MDSNEPARCGQKVRNVAELLNMTTVAAHEMTVAVLLLERHPNIRSRCFFQQDLGGASLSALAQVSDAQSLACDNRLSAIGALNGAVDSTAQVTHLIQLACARCYLTLDEATPALMKAEEAAAMVRASIAGLRPSHHEPAALHRVLWK
jgi:hypothetical protein